MVKIQVDSTGKAIMLNNRALEATSGGETDGDYLVQVIDYDGTILKSARLNTGATFTLPGAPTHSGLVFDGWSSPVTITNNTVTVVDQDITIGPMFHTSNGLSEFDITLTEVTGLNVTFNMNGTKDWGDGTTDTLTTHTYNSVGDYTITCNGSTMTTSDNSGLFGQSSSAINYYVKKVRFGSSITSISNSAFQNCYSLTSTIIPEDITSIGNKAFYYCYSLTSITIPRSVTSIGTNAFTYCYSLASITIPRGVTSMNTNAVSGCYSLTSITIPSSVISIGSYVFTSCYSLTNITIPEGVTSIYGAFENCYSLSSITIPSSLTNIPYAFQNCSSLTSVTIPSSVTSIGINAFSGCFSLTSITIPSSVTSIGGNVFNNCYSILEYDFSNHSAVPTLSSTNAFTNINQICKIKVPWDLYSNWKVATNWSTYADYIDGGTPATLNFTVTPSNSIIYVEGSQIQGTSTIWVGSTAPYTIYDSTNNVVLSNTQTGITEGATVNITADLTSYNKITLSTGAAGLTATAIINGLTFPMTEESSGNYSINVIGSGTTVDYFIEGGSNYIDASGSVTTTGSDITEAITLTPATELTFTRPNLTADGTLGGSSFAVKNIGASTLISTYAWRAVDNSATTFWNGNTPSSGDKIYVFYNPDALKVSELTYTYNSTSYIATAVSIEGSNNNSTWETITSTYSGSSTTYTSTLTNNKFYKYYKLTFTPYSSYVRVTDLAIAATYKAPAS